MKRAVAYVCAFLVLTVPLTWLWEVWARGAYGAFFSQVAGPIYGFFGLEGIPLGARERYVNYVPFLVLMALTPGFDVKRRLGWTAVGVLVLFVSHLVLNLLAALSPYGGSLPAPVAVVSDAMPFAVWAVFARDFLLRVAGRLSGESGESEVTS